MLRKGEILVDGKSTTKEKKKKAKIKYAEGVKEMKFPTKVFDWILELEKFLQEGDADFGCSDEQIMYNVNARLPREKRIAVSTWEAIKGSPDVEKGINKKASWTQEQKDFVKEMLNMTRAVKTYNLGKKLVNMNNRNANGVHKMLATHNKQFRNHDAQTLNIGTGGITLNIEAPKELIDLVPTLDIDHEDITGQKEITQ